MKFFALLACVFAAEYKVLMPEDPEGPSMAMVIDGPKSVPDPNCGVGVMEGSGLFFPEVQSVENSAKFR